MKDTEEQLNRLHNQPPPGDEGETHIEIVKRAMQYEVKRLPPMQHFLKSKIVWDAQAKTIMVQEKVQSDTFFKAESERPLLKIEWFEHWGEITFAPLPEEQHTDEYKALDTSLRDKHNLGNDPQVIQQVISAWVQAYLAEKRAFYESLEYVRIERTRRISAIEWVVERHRQERELFSSETKTTLTNSQYMQVLFFIQQLRDVPAQQVEHVNQIQWPALPEFLKSGVKAP